MPTDQLTPGDLVGTNKDSYLILEKLPAEYDNRVKAMEVDEKPTEEYSDIGGEMGTNSFQPFMASRYVGTGLPVYKLKSFASYTRRHVPSIII